MDINTPRGQATLADEQVAIGMFEKHYPASIYIQTPKDKPAVIDGIIVKNKILTGLAETKCRYNVSYETFATTWNSEWLVTFDKIEGGRRLADGHRVPLWGFLYIVESELLLLKKLYEPGAGWLTGFGVRKTETQATCNGGLVYRDNAYIDMSGAFQVKSGAAD